MHYHAYTHTATTRNTRHHYHHYHTHHHHHNHQHHQKLHHNTGHHNTNTITKGTTTTKQQTNKTPPRTPPEHHCRSLQFEGLVTIVPSTVSPKSMQREMHSSLQLLSGLCNEQNHSILHTWIGRTAVWNKTVVDVSHPLFEAILDQY